MTGVTATIDISHALPGLKAAAAGLAHPAPLLRQIGVYLVHSTQARFNAGTDPSGAPWAPLLPAYAAIKRGPSILIGAGMSGGLQGSITSEVGLNSVQWGSNKIYAAVHQFGAVIRPVKAKALRFHLGPHLVIAQKVTIPARPYLGLSDEDQEEIAYLAGRYVNKLLGSG